MRELRAVERDGILKKERKEQKEIKLRLEQKFDMLLMLDEKEESEL